MRLRNWLCAGVLSLAGPARAEIPQPPILLLTSQENGTEAQSRFSCSGSIYGVVTLPQKVRGTHILESIWTGPKGTVVRHSRDEVSFPAAGSRSADVWLRFTQDGGSLWNPLSVQAPGDQNRALYDGSWKVEVRWDDHSLARSDFTIQCL